MRIAGRRVGAAALAGLVVLAGVKLAEYTQEPQAPAIPAILDTHQLPGPAATPEN